MAIRNFEQAPNRAALKLWSGMDVSAFEQPPLLLNNESLLAINAAGTGTVALAKVNASDAVEFPGIVAFTGGFTAAAIARTATTDGTGTGTIASGPTIQFITVTAGSDANAIIILPAPTPGSIVFLHIAATGYELRTSAPGTIAINGGTGTAAESAIAANTTVMMICATATSWKGLQLGSDGTLAKVEVAAP